MAVTDVRFIGALQMPSPEHLCVGYRAINTVQDRPLAVGVDVLVG
jgi:hypothetical protein